MIPVCDAGWGYHSSGSQFVDLAQKYRNKNKFLRSEELTAGTYYFTGSRQGVNAFIVNTSVAVQGSGSLIGGGVIDLTTSVVKGAITEVPLKSIEFTGGTVTVLYNNEGT